ncbi:MAG TPA: energy transducer TonB [Acidobacteriaceae bacterium]|jgi:protein TonB|nr:energy transducer TonB [Acidobacteriaceae bacterium]
MPNDLVTPPELDPNKPAPLHPLPQQGRVSSDHLGIGGDLHQEGVFASLWENLRDACFPVKLPPLELTSQPIAVPDRMKVKRDPVTAAISFGIHALIILLIAFLLAKKVLKFAAPVKVVDVDINTPIAPLALKPMGGGGGNHDITPATAGKLPPPAKIPVPMMHPIIEQPKIPLPPSVELPPNVKMPMNLPVMGNPNGPKVAGPSSYGSGGGGGIGNGNGNGLGPGSDAGYGGGVYQVGGGVSAPEIIYGPEAPFTDEARRAKYQGDVNVDIIVGTDGLVKFARVTRDPGMGLGQSALDTVKTYKFKPSMKDGKPVAVRVTVEVGFTIY